MLKYVLQIHGIVTRITDTIFATTVLHLGGVVEAHHHADAPLGLLGGGESLRACLCLSPYVM